MRETRPIADNGFFCLPLVVLVFLLSGCMSDGYDTIVLPAPDRGAKPPASVIPVQIREQLEVSMPVYSGTAPPDISGQYRADNFALTGSNFGGDEIGKSYSDMYMSFAKGPDGKYSYRERQGSSELGSDNVVVEMVGSGNDFTAYFISTGVENGISVKRSTLISGTLTSNGIANLHYASILLEKGPDPQGKLPPVNTYRIFKDSDGSTGTYNWSSGGSSSSGSSSSTGGSSSSAPFICDLNPDVSYGSVTHEGQEYRTVDINGQVWFAENLNYAVSGSKCGNGSSLSDANTSTCDTYGRLYDWATAMNLPSSCNSNSCSGQIQSPHQGICPEHWHIPSDEDWDMLMNSVGGSSTAGNYLKATCGWNNYNNAGNGTDGFGFSALSGGASYSGGNFEYVGNLGNWWSSTEFESNNAWYREMLFSHGGVARSYLNKSYLVSVRCLHD